MFRTPLDLVAQKRTIRPLYANHQATPYGGFLDPAWDRSEDIWPGMVMARQAGELFTLFKGTAGQKPFGLSAMWVAPKLGIDEVRFTNTNLFTVWIGDSQFVAEILAPAFDTSADWSSPTNGSRKMLGATLAAHPQGPGKLSPLGGAAVGTDAVAELIQPVGTEKIIVRTNRIN